MTNDNATTDKGNTMTTSRFTNYIRYSTACPDGINPQRWQGMLKWARTHGLLITRVDRIGYL